MIRRSWIKIPAPLRYSMYVFFVTHGRHPQAGNPHPGTGTSADAQLSLFQQKKTYWVKNTNQTTTPQGLNKPLAQLYLFLSHLWPFSPFPGCLLNYWRARILKSPGSSLNTVYLALVKEEAPCSVWQTCKTPPSPRHTINVQ